MHTPVFLEEVIKALDPGPAKKYIDATYGEGGHSREILKRGGVVLAIEWDDRQIKNSKSKIKNCKFVTGNFANVEKIARENEFYPVDAVLFDLGLSMRQIEASGLGFSYKGLDEPLDMRIGPELDRTAADIINSYKLEELYEIFARNSEEIDSWAIAEAIVRARRIKEIKTVGELVFTIGGARAVSRLARIFQALRIEVNNEFINLKAGLAGALRILKKSGRIVVVTFHSIEDRVVKNFAKENKMKFLNLTPRKKLKRKFERSAKLRILI